MIHVYSVVVKDSLDVPAQFLYRVEYYLEGIRVSSIESMDLTVCLREIELKMKMDMGHVRGKVFTTRTGREL
jgi:hypothetical protein